jgi:hypothetical protein
MPVNGYNSFFTIFVIIFPDFLSIFCFIRSLDPSYMQNQTKNTPFFQPKYSLYLIAFWLHVS